jgi:hypothetical protein
MANIAKDGVNCCFLHFILRFNAFLTLSLSFVSTETGKGIKWLYLREFAKPHVKGRAPQDYS